MSVKLEERLARLVEQFSDAGMHLHVHHHFNEADRHLHVHVHDAAFGQRESQKLDTILALLEGLMTAAESMKAALAAINEATNNIAADVTGLKAKISSAMTPEEVAEVQGILDATAAKLQAIAASTPDA